MARDLRQSKEWAQYLKQSGWIVDKIGDNKVYIRPLPLGITVAKIQRPAPTPFLDEIDHLARKHRVFLVKLELERGEENNRPPGFKPDKAPHLPTKIMALNLRRAEEDIWKGLSENARRNIKKARRRGLTVISSWEKRKKRGALEAFSNLLQQTAKRRSFWGPSTEEIFTKADCFGEKAGLILAYHHQKLIGGLLTLYSGETLYHEHSATSEEGEAANAPYLLVWEAIKEGKKRRLECFDLGGIYDRRYHQATKRWRGFTVFKSRFKGKEIEYPKPLVRYYHPLAKGLSKIRGV